MLRTTAILLASLLAASASLPATQGLLAPTLEVKETGLPDPLDVATRLAEADSWLERYLAFAAYFHPTLQPPPLVVETRSIPNLVGLTYDQLGTPLTPEQAQHLQAQVDQLPPGVAYGLQQLLGAVLLSIIDWHLATALLTPQDWEVLAEFAPGTMTEQELLQRYGELKPVLLRIDAPLLQFNAARLIATLDHVLPVLEDALTHPLLQQPRAVPPFPGPNEGILFNDPFNLIMVGDVGKSVYYANTWPYPTFGPYEHLLIIDLAGEDEYRNHPARANPGLCIVGLGPCGNSFVSIVLDVTGNDLYLPHLDGSSIGSAIDGGIAIILDAAGNDRYIETNFGGVSIGNGDSEGLGLVFDATGNDYYQSSTLTQGAASSSRAIGMLIDASGNEVYHGGDRSQGATSVQGYGFYADLGGDDLVNSGYFAQGRAFAGGVGFHLNLGGNDVYNGRPWSRGYTDDCWQDPTILPIPDCPNGMDDWAAVFLDICGFDAYSGWLGGDDEEWQQSDFGYGRDLRDVGLCTGNE